MFIIKILRNRINNYFFKDLIRFKNKFFLNLFIQQEFYFYLELILVLNIINFFIIIIIKINFKI
jgi:hypothetical protein